MNLSPSWAHKTRLQREIKRKVGLSTIESTDVDKCLLANAVLISGGRKPWGRVNVP